MPQEAKRPQRMRQSIAIRAREQSRRVAEIKSRWPDPDAHFKPDPDFALCVAVLDQANTDIADGQMAIEALRKARKTAEAAINDYFRQIQETRKAFKNAAIAIRWAEHPEHQWLSLDTIAKRSGYDPQRMAEVLLGKIHRGIADFIQKKPVPYAHYANTPPNERNDADSVHA
jgi:hypothetical protein